MRSKNPEYFTQLENIIDSYTDEHGRSPSVREIAKEMNVSIATVSRYISYMRDEGMLDYDGHRHIITKHQSKKNNETVDAAVYGNIACGEPIFAESNVQEYVPLPTSIFGKGEFFVLKAKGESMIDIGIDDGDLVVIKKQNHAERGEIIVALIDDEATLKRYYPEPKKHRIRLHPENEDMEDIIVDDCIIQGVAVKVIKDIF